MDRVIIFSAYLLASFARTSVVLMRLYVNSASTKELNFSEKRINNGTQSLFVGDMKNHIQPELHMRNFDGSCRFFFSKLTSNEFHIVTH